jgi:hypothetical protein
MGKDAIAIAAHSAGHSTGSRPAEGQGIVDGEGRQALQGLILPDYTAQRRDELLRLYTQ